MNFIKTYFKSKLMAIKLLWQLADFYWGQEMYIWSCLWALWAFVCSTVSWIIVPVDLIFTVICCTLFEGFREGMNEFREWLEETVYYFQELREES